MNLDKDMIGKLWDEVTPRLYGYLLHRLQNRDLADDILQSTWLKAIEALPKFHDAGRGLNAGFSSWLFMIAKNEMRMHWRKGGREVPYDEDIHEESAGDMKNEDRIFLEQVLSKLSEEDQEIIRLRYIADLSMGDMARLLKFNPVTVRVKVHRALGRVQAIIKQQL
jgi:RNA polymerase sigma-70 factor (ECF subfamily)